MLAPKQIDERLLAACGMNCLLCYQHLGKKPCGGCFSEAENKPNRCRTCKIRVCALEQGLRLCAQCAEFPCKQIKSLDKSYRTRYGVSLVDAGREAVRSGIASFLRWQAARYTCSACGGLISLHDGDCSSCKKQYPLGRAKDGTRF